MPKRSRTEGGLGSLKNVTQYSYSVNTTVTLTHYLCVIKKGKIMETIKFYIDFFGGGDAEKAWDTLKVCPLGKERWSEWVSNGNDPFAYVPPAGWEWLKKTAVSSPKATAEMLEEGAEDEDWLVRRAAVSHPNYGK